MVDKQGPGKAGREFIDIIRCHVKYGGSLTASAIEEATRLRTFSLAAVTSILNRLRAAPRSVECLDPNEHPLMAYKVVIPEVTQYQALLEDNHECVA
ncbi:MAG TPA: hypothetical protein V6D17_10075 [Candidatus Obscuribacterales bacterium]